LQLWPQPSLLDEARKLAEARPFFGPSKTDAPLIIDPDEVLSPTAAGQGLF